MFKVHSSEEARLAYTVLRSCASVNDAAAMDLKKNVRAWSRMVPEIEETILSSDYDGYDAITVMPKSITTRRAAGVWFRDHVFAEATPSQYDCTGQRFTIRQKIFQRNGRWCAFHAERFDV